LCRTLLRRKFIAISLLNDAESLSNARLLCLRLSISSEDELALSLCLPAGERDRHGRAVERQLALAPHQSYVPRIGTIRRSRVPPAHSMSVPKKDIEPEIDLDEDEEPSLPQTEEADAAAF